MTIIDAHTHLWLRQDAVVDGQHIEALPGHVFRILTQWNTEN